MNFGKLVRIRRIVGFFAILVNLITLTDTLNAQVDDTDKTRMWVSIGLGKYGGDAAYKLSVSQSWKNHLLACRIIKSEEIRFNVEGHYDKPQRNAKGVAIMYGRFYRRHSGKQAGQLSLTAGVSYVNGIYRGNQLQYDYFEEKKISTISFALEGNFRLEFGKYFGIGFAAFSDMNRQKSYFGGAIELQLGKF